MSFLDELFQRNQQQQEEAARSRPPPTVNDLIDSINNMMGQDLTRTPNVQQVGAIGSRDMLQQPKFLPPERALQSPEDRGYYNG